MIVSGIRYVPGANDYDDTDDRKYGIGIHNTSNDATDTGEAAYAEWRPDGTSSHFYADRDSVTQSLDTNVKAGHAGSSIGNENAVAVEITGTNGKTREWWLANVAWAELGRVLAAVIAHHWPDGSFQVRRATVAEMKSNPRVKAFYGHDDMRRAWGGTTHTDPGSSFPWDRLFSAVNAAMGGDDMFCRKGDTGPKVRRVQLGINKIDTAAGKPAAELLKVDDVYGTATVAAVKRVLGGTGEDFNAELDLRLIMALARIAVPPSQDGQDGEDGEDGTDGRDGVVVPGTVLVVQSVPV